MKKEEASLAREMESRLLDVRTDAGILFVGVSVRPTSAGEDPLYFVWLGCNRDANEELMGPLVDNLFAKEISAGVKIQVEAHRGVVQT